jgi:hypothetical protein
VKTTFIAVRLEEQVLADEREDVRRKGPAGRTVGVGVVQYGWSGLAGQPESEDQCQLLHELAW